MEQYINTDEGVKNTFYGTSYKEKCVQCGKEHEVKTQEDDRPEYYTDVYIKCECGNNVKFELPVN